MIVLIGASASGKTEIAKKLVEKHNVKKCITTTTRPMRIGETNDFDYHFITKEEFVNGINNKDFIEYAIYSDNYYGINRKDVFPNSVVVVEPTGANNLIDALKNDAFIVFIESNKSIRMKRMIARGDKKIDIDKRLENDDVIFKREALKRIDLSLDNNEHKIADLAEKIMNYYSNEN
ncbi:MAG: AAA family ATPase [Acholeplasma sp.]|nr:AAA family ATPase [Acholeplasma sp.]